MGRDRVIVMREKISTTLISLCLLILCFLTGCDSYADRYPFLKDGKWVCDDPCFTIVYTTGTDGVISAVEILEWDGERIQVDVKFHADSFSVCLEGAVRYEDRLLTGTWEYRDEKLVLRIEEDFVFEKQYDELVFSAAVIG